MNRIQDDFIFWKEIDGICIWYSTTLRGYDKIEIEKNYKNLEGNSGSELIQILLTVFGQLYNETDDVRMRLSLDFAKELSENDLEDFAGHYLDNNTYLNEMLEFADIPIPNQSKSETNIDFLSKKFLLYWKDEQKIYQGFKRSIGAISPRAFKAIEANARIAKSLHMSATAALSISNPLKTLTKLSKTLSATDVMSKISPGIPIEDKVEKSEEDKLVSPQIHTIKLLAEIDSKADVFIGEMNEAKNLVAEIAELNVSNNEIGKDLLAGFLEFLNRFKNEQENNKRYSNKMILIAVIAIVLSSIFSFYTNREASKNNKEMKALLDEYATQQKITNGELKYFQEIADPKINNALSILSSGNSILNSMQVEQLKALNEINSSVKQNSKLLEKIEKASNEIKINNELIGTHLLNAPVE